MKSLAGGAIVGATIALVFILATRAQPEWGVPAMLGVVGLGAAALFARLYVREPPSLERFQWLTTYGFASVASLALGALAAAARLVTGFGPGGGLMFLAVGAGALLVGMFGF